MTTKDAQHLFVDLLATSLSLSLYVNLSVQVFGLIFNRVVYLLVAVL